MRLTDEAIKEFIEIFFQKRGIKLSYEEGSKMAIDWMAFYRIVKQKSYMINNENDNSNRLPQK